VVDAGPAPTIKIRGSGIVLHRGAARTWLALAATHAMATREGERGGAAPGMRRRARQRMVRRRMFDVSAPSFHWISWTPADENRYVVIS